MSSLVYHLCICISLCVLCVCAYMHVSVLICRDCYAPLSPLQPPPPGVAATAGQLAAMQGQQVVGQQQKKDVLFGGSDGGYTFF